jgi:hypothetical protein
MPLKYATRRPAAYFSETLKGVVPSVVLPASMLVRKEMICPPSVAEMPVMASSRQRDWNYR